MALGNPVAAAAAYNTANGTTSVTPAYPTGIQSTDVLVLFVGQKPSTANGGTVTTPDGWTLRDELTGAGGYGTTLAADTGNTNLRVYTKDIVTGSETGNLSITLGTNNISWAFILRVPTGTTNRSYGSSDGSDTTAGNVSVTLAANPGLQTNDLAIWAMCIPTDITTPSQFSAHAISATGATFGTVTEINEPDSGTNNDIGGFSAYAFVTNGTASVAPTITATAGGTTTNVRGPLVLLRIRELRALTLPADTKSYTLTGNDATLTYVQNLNNYSITADTANFDLIERDATLRKEWRIFAERGGFGIDAVSTTSVFSDDFNRADSNSLGSNWQVQQGGFQITSNTVKGQSAFQFSTATVTTGNYGQNQFAEITVSAFTPNINDYIGVGVRLTGLQGYYFAADRWPQRRLFKRDSSGVSTVISSSDIYWKVGDVIRLTAEKNIISLYRNGSLVERVVDSSYSSGVPAVYYRRDNIGGASGDNFICGNLVDNTNLRVARRLVAETGLYSQVTETFSGADLSQPATLTQMDIAFAVSDGAGNLKCGDSARAVAYTQGVTTSEHYSEFTITALPSAGQVIGVGARIQTSGTGFYYFGAAPGSSSNYIISEYDAGVIATSTIVPRVGDRIRIEARGSTLYGYVNGILACQATDTTYLTGRPGVVLFGLGTARADNLQTGPTITYELAEQDATLRATRKLTSDFSTYDLIERDANLRAARKLTAEQQTYTVVEQTATLTKIIVLTAQTQTFTYSGSEIFFGRYLSLARATFTITGPPTGLTAIADSHNVIINPPAGWALHLVTDVSQAGNSACIYYGLSPAVSIGDQILHRTTTETNGRTVTVSSTGIVSSTPSGIDTVKFRHWTPSTWSAELTFSLTVVNAYTLTADTRSYTLTLQDANLIHAARLTADVRSYTLTRNDANLIHAARLTADTRSYTLTGNDANLLQGHRLTADTRSYTLTRNDANLRATRTLIANAQAYTLDPIIPGTRVVTNTLAGTSHLVSGIAVPDNAKLIILIALEDGAVIISNQLFNGVPLQLIRRDSGAGYVTEVYYVDLSVVAGSYNLTFDCSVSRTSAVSIFPLQYASSGIIENLAYNFTASGGLPTVGGTAISVSNGSYLCATTTNQAHGDTVLSVSSDLTLGGTDSASLMRVTQAYGYSGIGGNKSAIFTYSGASGNKRSYLISIAKSSKNVNLVHSSVLSADTRSYTLTRNDANLLQGHRLTADTRSYTLTGNDANLLHAARLTADTQSYTLILNDGDFFTGGSLIAGHVHFNITANDANLIHAAQLTAEGFRANYLRNSMMVGTIAGTPGTAPTSWATAQAAWATRTIIGTGIDSTTGLTYIDVAYSGTNNTGSISSLIFDPISGTTQLANNGETWTSSAYFGLVSGSWPSNANILNTFRNSSAVAVGNSTVSIKSISSSTLQRFTATFTANNIATKYVQTAIRFDVANGETVGFTVRIAAPQLERGSIARAFIPTTNAVEYRSFETTFVPANLLQGHRLTADTRTYSLTGNAVNLLKSTIVRTQHFRANLVRNSQATGAVVGVLGSGGVLPSGWGVGSTLGITREVVAVGTMPDGNPYIDIRWSGTNNSGATSYPDLYPISAEALAFKGNKFTASIYIKTVAGSRAGLSSSLNNVAVSESKINGLFLTSTGVTVPEDSRASASRTFTSGDVECAKMYVSMAIPAGNSVDVTLRFSAPQLEPGLTATAYIPTTGTQVFRDYSVEGIAANLLQGHRLTAESRSYAVTLRDANLLQGYRLTAEEFRSNLLNYSEQFDNTGAWFKTATTITANAITAPNGTQTADKLTENTGNGPHEINRTSTINIALGVTYTFTVYGKAAERSRFRIQFDAGVFPNNALAFFDFSTGTVYNIGASATASISAAGNGWYRAIITATATSTGNNRPAVYVTLASTGTTIFYTGDGASGIYLWGAQLEKSSSATAYIPTVATAEYRWFETSLKDANLLQGHRLTADTRSYTLTRNDANLLQGHRLTAESRSYTFIGNDANLRTIGKLIADTRSYTLTGNSVNLLRGAKLVTEGFRGNYIPNSSMQGASIGTLPTTWTSYTSSGVTISVVAAGTDSNGNQYVDIRAVGSASATVIYPTISFIENSIPVYTKAGETWTGAVDIQQVSGTTAELKLSVRELKADASHLTEGVFSITPTSSLQRYSKTHTLINSGSERTNFWIYFVVNPSQSIDTTIRVSRPQFEKGPVARAFIPTTNAVEYRWFETNFISANLLQGHRLTADTRSYALTRNNANLLVARRIAAEEFRANYIRNSMMVGTVAGTPGTAPTFWQTPTPAWCTRTIVGTGIDINTGLIYIDISFNGTNNTGSTSTIFLDPMLPTGTQAQAGETWTSSAYFGLVSGSWPASISYLATVGRDSTGTFLESSATSIKTVLSSNLEKITRTFTTTNFSVKNIQTAIRFDMLAGDSINLTVRIAAPQLERGSVAREFIPTTNAVQYRWFETSLKDANLLQGYRLAAESRSYTLTGNAAEFLNVGTLSAETATYNLVGNSVNLRVQRRIVAQTRSYSLTGTNVNLLEFEVLRADSRSYTFTGNSANILISRRITAQVRSYDINDISANILFNRKLFASTATFTTSYSDINKKFGRNLIASTLYVDMNGYVEGGYVDPNYTSTSASANLLASKKITISSQTYTLIGQEILFVRPVKLVRVWDGTSWTPKLIKVWSGTIWVEKPVRRWTGSSWQ